MTPAPLAGYSTRTKRGNIVLVVGTNGAGVQLPAVQVRAYAAQVVITVTQTSANGYLAAHAAGSPVPATSTINWTTLNTTIATGTVVPVDASGRLAITAGPGSSTHIIVDVLGYFIIATV